MEGPAVGVGPSVLGVAVACVGTAAKLPARAFATLWPCWAELYLRF